MEKFSENMQEIWGTPVPKCDFNKVALQLYWNYTSAGCFPVDFLLIFRTSFHKNTSGGLLISLIQLNGLYNLFRLVQSVWLIKCM